MKRNFESLNSFAGGYGLNDGTIDLYTRIGSLIDANSRILNIGAGRGSWFFEDKCVLRRNLQNLKDKVAYYVGADPDQAVLGNQTTHENFWIENGLLPFVNESFDLVVADWVLEHVQDVDIFVQEIDRVLKTGGYFVARTPLKFNYVSILSIIIPNRFHSRIVKLVQPTRSTKDVFPTHYKLNTRKTLTKRFPNYEDQSYIFVASPAYFFGSKLLFWILEAFSKFLPRFFVGNLHVFFKKKETN